MNINPKQSMKLTSPSAIMDARVLYAALCILKESGDSIPRKKLVEYVEKRIDPSEWEKELVEVSGEVRWISALNFRSIDYVKSGYLLKSKGEWRITAEGVEALELGEVDLFLTAKEKYKEWRDNKKSLIANTRERVALKQPVPANTPVDSDFNRSPLSKHFFLSKTNGHIELWMKERLKHQGLPDWMKDVRALLQNELLALQVKADQMIEGQYVSRDNSGPPFDVENVLFYNVRVSHFKKNSLNGVRFRFLFQEPPHTQDTLERWAHYQSYRIVDVGSPFLGDCENIAEFEFCIQGERNNEGPEPHEVWWEAVSNPWNIVKSSVDKYGLIVDAKYPRGIKNRPYAAFHIKKIFDGIVASMHSCQNPDEVLVQRVATRLDVSFQSVFEKIKYNKNSLLGERYPLFFPTKSFVRWNPDDSNCVAGQLRFSGNSENEWRFKVQIVSMEAV